MKTSVKAIPDGYQSLIPHLIVKGADQAIEFYKKAFDAELLGRAPGPDGKTVIHAEMKIGDSRFFLADEVPQMGCTGPQSLGGTPVTIHRYVEDVDAAFNKAVAAGAKSRMGVADMFWGDRYGVLIDPFGHNWSLATHKEDVSPEELRKRVQTLCASGSRGS